MKQTGAVLALALLVGAGAMLAAQDRPVDTAQDPGQSRATFRSGSRMVHVYPTVQRDGRLVPDLTREEFRVFEDGQERPLTVFDNTPQAITVAVMFDMSNSMAGQLTKIRESARAFVKALAPADRVRIGTFGSEVAISPLLTGDKLVLQRILDEELWPGGPTPLWYATDLAMSTLDKEPGRRVVLLFTDGDDSGRLLTGGEDASVFPPGNVREIGQRAERDGFMVYVVGLPRRKLTDEVRTLATDTGGGHFTVRNEDDLAATFTRVVEELHHQYVLGFSSDAADGQSHTIEVKTTRPGVKVRARKSYVGVAEGAGQ